MQRGEVDSKKDHLPRLKNSQGCECGHEPYASLEKDYDISRQNINVQRHPIDNKGAYCWVFQVVKCCYKS